MENKFELGTIYITRGIQEKIDADVNFEDRVKEALARYKTCDWGDLGEEDFETNNQALDPENPDRILAAYNIDPKIWIITEWDRSVTTILLPEEY